MTQQATIAQVRRWRALKTRADRLAQGVFLVEGAHMTAEAVCTGRVRTLLFRQDRAHRFPELTSSGVPCALLTDAQFAQVTDSKTPQGVAALCSMQETPAIKDLGARIVALNAVQDPGNVGTILRTMDAAGFTGLLTDMQTADAFSSKALSASMGSVFRIPVHVTQNLVSALDSLIGFDIIAGDLRGAPFYERPPARAAVCLLIGSEGAGLHPEVLARATMRLRLPLMGGAESLNAAVAASVMMYDLLRERMQNTNLL